eukprot:scaffold4173_cov117-Isochrysis_galbana.AAC.16
MPRCTSRPTAPIMVRFLFSEVVLSTVAGAGADQDQRLGLRPKGGGLSSFEFELPQIRDMASFQKSGRLLASALRPCAAPSAECPLALAIDWRFSHQPPVPNLPPEGTPAHSVKVTRLGRSEQVVFTQGQGPLYRAAEEQTRQLQAVSQ